MRKMRRMGCPEEMIQPFAQRFSHLIRDHSQLKRASETSSQKQTRCSKGQRGMPQESSQIRKTDLGGRQHQPYPAQILPGNCTCFLQGSVPGGLSAVPTTWSVSCSLMTTSKELSRRLSQDQHHHTLIALAITSLKDVQP